MSVTSYRYTLLADIPAAEVEASLLLSVLAAESIHGEAQMQFDAAHRFDPRQRTVTIDGSTAVGRDLNRLFIGFLTREFGPAAFRVERVDAVTPQPQPAGAG